MTSRAASPRAELAIPPLLLLSAISRFDSSYVVADNACWIWTGQVGGNNQYGRIVVAGHRIGAHRFSWIRFNEKPIPRGYDVHHKCVEPRCVNPRHLEACLPYVNQGYRRRRRCGLHNLLLRKMGKRWPRWVCRGCHAARARKYRAAKRLLAGSTGN